MDKDLNNTEKNMDKRLLNLRSDVGFTSTRQPSSKVKREGWERKRVAQAFMDLVFKYQNMSVEKFNALANDMKSNPKKYKVSNIMAMRYTAKSFDNDKFMLDWIDRHISKAPQDIDVKSNGKEIKGVTVKIIRTKEELEQYGNRNAVDTATGEDS